MIVVLGGGKNVLWMRVNWFVNKWVVYWGDIDFEGFVIFSDVCSKLSMIILLMMDLEIVEVYWDRMVDELELVIREFVVLIDCELMFFRMLCNGDYGSMCLE